MKARRFVYSKLCDGILPEGDELRRAFWRTGRNRVLKRPRVWCYGVLLASAAIALLVFVLRKLAFDYNMPGVADAAVPAFAAVFPVFCYQGIFLRLVQTELGKLWEIVQTKTCAACKQDLAANTSDVCPGCGTRIPEVVVSMMGKQPALQNASVLREQKH